MLLNVILNSRIVLLSVMVSGKCNTVWYLNYTTESLKVFSYFENLVNIWNMIFVSRRGSKNRWRLPRWLLYSVESAKKPIWHRANQSRRMQWSETGRWIIKTSASHSIKYYGYARATPVNTYLYTLHYWKCRVYLISAYNQHIIVIITRNVCIFHCRH